MTLNERVRLRLCEARDALHITDREIANRVSFSYAKVNQKMTGRSPITLDELEELSQAVGLRPTETVRERGYEFVAEMAPTELKIYEQYHRLKDTDKKLVTDFLDRLVQMPLERRGITDKLPVRARKRHS